jgi:hypothetical protein
MVKKRPEVNSDTNQGCVIRLKNFQMKIDMNQRYLNRINDLENKGLALGLLLNCPKTPVFKPLTHQFILKHHPWVTLTSKH